MSSHPAKYTGNANLVDDVVEATLRTRDEVVTELITLITQAVNLQHLDKSTLNADTRLTRPASTADAASTNTLGLDSIDILEAVVVVEHKYGVKIEDASKGEQVFKTFGTVADFILSQ